MEISGQRPAGAATSDAARVLYVLFGVLAVVPIVLFVVLGISAESFSLQGAGGPLVAYAAGVLSFVSPCVLPLVPIYITQIAGASVVNGEIQARRWTTFSHAVAFLTGLTIVFVALGASVGLVGYVVRDNQRELEQGAGLLLILLGALIVPAYGRRSPMRSAALLLVMTVVLVALVELAQLKDNQSRLILLTAAFAVAWAKFAGYLDFSFFSRTFQFDPGARRSVGYGRSALIGGAFAVGWTPCVGPILGGILTLAATSGEALTGAYLLLIYALGFSIPFLITGLAVADVSRGLRKLQPYMKWFEVASAVMIIGLGVLLLSGRLTALNDYFNFADFNQGL